MSDPKNAQKTDETQAKKPESSSSNPTANSSNASTEKAAAQTPVNPDEPRLSVYVYHSKTNTPNSIKNLIENLTKQKDEGSLGFEFQSTESAAALTARLISRGYGIAVLSIGDEKEMQQAHLVLGKLSQGINQGLIRVLIVNKFNESKTLQNLKVRGAYEILDFSMNVKSLTFKMNTAIKLTDQQYKRTLNGKAKTSSIQEAQKNDKRGKSDHSCSTIFEASDQNAADFWNLPSEHNVRYVMGRVVVELLGPGPVSGHWTSTDSERNDEPGWMWNPRHQSDSPFFTTIQGARWVFYGRQPDFSWQSNLWNFVSKAPYLALYAENGKDVLTVRFQKDGPSKFKIKKNTSDASKWIALIKETIEASMKQKDTLVAEKAANDYRMKTGSEGSESSKDYIDKGQGPGKPLEGKFGADLPQGKPASDFVNKAGPESKEMSVQLESEKARELNDRTSKTKEKETPFNQHQSEKEEETPFNGLDAKSAESQDPQDREHHGRDPVYGRPDKKKSATPKSVKSKDASVSSEGPLSSTERSEEGLDEKKAALPSAVGAVDSAHAPDLSESEADSETESAAESENKSKTKGDARADRLNSKDSTSSSKKKPPAEKEESTEDSPEPALLSAREAMRMKREKAAEKEAKREQALAEKREKQKAETQAKLEAQAEVEAKKAEEIAEKAQEIAKKIEEVREENKAKIDIASPSLKEIESVDENPDSLDSPQSVENAAHAEREKKSQVSKTAAGAKNLTDKTSRVESTTSNPRQHDLRLASDSKNSDSRASSRASKSARFEVFLLGKDGAPLADPVLVSLLEIEADRISIDAGAARLASGDTVKIKVVYECEPDSVVFETKAEVEVVESFGESESCLLKLDASSGEKFGKIALALVTRRELLMDFFRMARGEEKYEKAA